MKADKIFYEILGVAENATPDEIKKAYRLAASKYHPDKNKGKEEWATAKFKEIKDAYEHITEPEKFAQQQHHQGHSWRGMSEEDIIREMIRRSMGGSSAEHFEYSFGGGGGNQNFRRTVAGNLVVDIVDLHKGFKKEISSNNGLSFDIDVPAGTPPGSRITKEIGNTTYIMTLVPDFGRFNQGHQLGDLVLAIDVSYIDLILGTTVEISDIEDVKLQVKIPQQFRPSQRLNIPNKGYSVHGKRGSLWIVVNPVASNLSEEQLNAIEKVIKGNSSV